MLTKNQIRGMEAALIALSQPTRANKSVLRASIRDVETRGIAVKEGGKYTDLKRKLTTAIAGLISLENDLTAQEAVALYRAGRRGTCVMCGTCVTQGDTSDWCAREVDHLFIPRVAIGNDKNHRTAMVAQYGWTQAIALHPARKLGKKGGSPNCQLVCRSCNKAKGDMMLGDFLTIEGGWESPRSGEGQIKSLDSIIKLSVKRYAIAMEIGNEDIEGLAY